MTGQRHLEKLEATSDVCEKDVYKSVSQHPWKERIMFMSCAKESKLCDLEYQNRVLLFVFLDHYI